MPKIFTANSALVFLVIDFSNKSKSIFSVDLSISTNTNLSPS